MVTYLRANEDFTEDLARLADSLYRKYGGDFSVAVCTETERQEIKKDYRISYCMFSGTKYRRLINLMENDDSEYYLSVDNDIDGNDEEILRLVDRAFSENADIAWGRIMARRQNGLISNLVGVDKLLSHNIIRPLLWRLGVGISVPGQIFLIKGNTYRSKLIDIDTFLDDLALGLYVNINKNNKLVSDRVLGYERPNSTFIGLWRQRARWAAGYASILRGTWGNKRYLPKILIHGFSYHLLWMIHWIICISLTVWEWPAGVLYLLLCSALIAWKDISMYGYAVIYQFLFPIFHFKWGCTLIKQLLKG